MTIGDEMLMAYLDNELPPDERARVDAALAGDADLRARLKSQERVHAMLGAAFGPMIDRPVPDRLVQAAMTTPVSFRWRMRGGFARLFDGGGVSWIPAASLSTAALVLGVGIGWMTSGSQGAGGGNDVMAQGTLANVLEQRLASDDAAGGPHVGVSFRAKSGALCRTFNMAATANNAAGIACRGNGGWAVKTLAPAEPRSGTSYETVGAAMPDAVRGALNDMISGEPLDAAQEQAARAAGWR